MVICMQNGDVDSCNSRHAITHREQATEDYPPPVHSHCETYTMIASMQRNESSQTACKKQDGTKQHGQAELPPYLICTVQHSQAKCSLSKARLANGSVSGGAHSNASVDTSECI